MSSAEFTRWIAYANHEPFGYPVENYRMGTSTASVVNAVHASIPVAKGKRRPKAKQASEYYPKQKKPEPDLTTEQREHIRKKRAKRVKK